MFLKHLVSRLVTSEGRGSALDPCAFPLLPGGLEQWLAEALQLVEVEVRATDGPANGLHLVKAYPDYGPGVDGWREDLSLSGNLLAGRGLGATVEQGDAFFYAWLLGQAKDLDPLVLLTALPE